MYRSAALGVNPVEKRKLMREPSPVGFYIAITGKRSIRTLHALGACFNASAGRKSEVCLCRHQDARRITL